LALSTFSGKGSPLNMSVQPCSRKAGSSDEMSSPNTTAMRGCKPCDAAKACKALAQASGLMPPALATTLMPRCITSGSTDFMAMSTNSVA
jgi:hypothetical protein